MVGEVSIDIVIVIYVDNILVGSKDVESHVKELNMVIHTLTKVGFKLKPSKCKIAYSAIQFMGPWSMGTREGFVLSKQRSLLRCKDQGWGKRFRKS